MTIEGLEAVARAFGKCSRRMDEILWPREVAWASMTTSGEEVLWDVKEVHMPLTYQELA